MFFSKVHFGDFCFQPCTATIVLGYRRAAAMKLVSVAVLSFAVTFVSAADNCSRVTLGGISTYAAVRNITYQLFEALCYNIVCMVGEGMHRVRAHRNSWCYPNYFGPSRSFRNVQSFLSSHDAVRVPLTLASCIRYAFLDIVKDFTAQPRFTVKVRDRPHRCSSCLVMT